jgi:sugar phosphate isomerase/epimerase
MVGVCLDPVNSISKLSCPKETISLLAPLTVSIHAKDVVIQRLNTGFYITGCPLGQGLIDLPEMLDTIRNSGRNPNILVESWMDKLDDEAATLAQEQTWICQGLAYLRRLL